MATLCSFKRHPSQHLTAGRPREAITFPMLAVKDGTEEHEGAKFSHKVHQDAGTKTRTLVDD